VSERAAASVLPPSLPPRGLRVLVCGGRGYRDWPQLSGELDRLHAERDFAEVIHGAAPGADTLADTWARSRGIVSRQFIALWQTEGKAAGPRRNQRMLDEGQPDLVVAFSGGKGTDDMVRRAKAAGVEVVEVFAALDGDEAAPGNPLDGLL